MEQPFDRRRTPRVQLPPDDHCELHLRTRVQLLDISLSGALVGADTLVPVGAHGQLRFGLGGTAYAPTVQVRRYTNGPQHLGLGTVFTSMDENSRQRLEAFLRKATA